MASNNKKVTELPILSSVSAGDWIYIVDASDTTQNTNGSSYRVKASIFKQVATATTTELADVTDAINTGAEKVAGYMVFNTTTNAPVWAEGATDADVWNDATGTTAHSPA